MNWVGLLENLKTGFERLKVACGLKNPWFDEGIDRREADRTQGRIALICQRWNCQTMRAVGLDVSTKGMRLEVPTRLKKGEKIMLAPVLPNTNTVADTDVVVRVIWCKRQRGLPSYHCGTRFVLKIPEQQRAVAYFLLEYCKLRVKNPPKDEQRDAPAPTPAPTNSETDSSDSGWLEEYVNDPTRRGPSKPPGAGA